MSTQKVYIAAKNIDIPSIGIYKVLLSNEYPVIIIGNKVPIMRSTAKVNITVY